MKKILFGMVLIFLGVSCSGPADIKGTIWKGEGANKDIELVLNDFDGFIIKHYSEIDRDSFYISYELIEDSVIITRKDDIVSMKESFLVTSDTLKGNSMIFIKEQ